MQYTTQQHHRYYSAKAIPINSNPTKIIHYGNANDGLTIPLSKLTSRHSAELEDELIAKLNSNKNDDDTRLMDPILHQPLTRKGLNWIRSVSLPAKYAALSSEMSTVRKDDESITVTIQPSTLLHPKLAEIASNVAHFLQEEMIALLKSRSNCLEEYMKEKQIKDLQPENIAVTIKILSDLPRQRSTAHMNMSNKQKHEMLSNLGPGLQNVKHFIAVYSCKGGVGKSTIATNLAYQLASTSGGYGNVGLLDLDVYGPSLPLLVKPSDPTVRQCSPDVGEGMIEPIEHKGVKLMSLGYVSPNSGVPGSGPNSGAAVLRGPMAGRVVSQLLKGTNWGTLDVLILDLPPGTGDVQLEVCQSLSLSGAVAVSTPSNLAWADVVKGVSMFGELGVNTLALVENMAYFVCEGGGRHYPFGKARALGAKKKMATTTGEGEKVVDEEEEDALSDPLSSSPLANHFLPSPSHVFHLPISSSLNECNDSGIPLCLEKSSADNTSNQHSESVDEELLTTFAKLADAISTDLLLLHHGKTPLSMQGKSSDKSAEKAVLTVMVDEAGDSEFDVPFTQLSVDNEHKNFTVRLFSNEGGYQKVISGRELRIRDPRTGEVDASLEDGAFHEAPKPNHNHGGGCGSGHGVGRQKPPSPGQQLPPMVHHHTANSDESVEKDGLFPAKITKKGNYGYEVEWADGATIIYSLLAIAKAAGGKPTES